MTRPPLSLRGHKPVSSGSELECISHNPHYFLKVAFQFCTCKLCVSELDTWAFIIAALKSI